MRKIFLILLVFYAIFMVAAENINLTNDMSLLEVSKKSAIPIKKLRIMLKIDQNIDNTTSLQKLNISNKKIADLIKQFNSDKNSYLGGIAIVGMLIVFVSLAIVALIIGRLKIIQRCENRKIVKTTIGEMTGPSNMSANDVVAAITAIYLHEMEADKQNKLLLTWKRRPLEMWSAANKVNLPNRIYFNNRNNRQES